MCRHIRIDHAHQAPRHALLGNPLAVVDAEDLHALVVREVGEELRRDEEVLPAVLAAGDLDEGLVYGALGAAVHTLVDLVDEGEGRTDVFGEGHEVEDRGQGSFLSEK